MRDDEVTAALAVWDKVKAVIRAVARGVLQVLAEVFYIFIALLVLSFVFGLGILVAIGLACVVQRLSEVA